MTREPVIPRSVWGDELIEGLSPLDRILARTGLAECLLSKGFAGGGPLAELSVFGGQRRFHLRRRLNGGQSIDGNIPFHAADVGRIEQASAGRYETLLAFLSCPHPFAILCRSRFFFR